MIPFHRIAGLIYNRPLLITPQAAQTISGVILSRIEARGGANANTEHPIEETQYFPPSENADGSFTTHSPRASRFVGQTPTNDNGKPAPYRVTKDGTAIISIIGELVNRGAWVGASSGLVSYEGVTYQLAQAAGDSRVKNILLDIESPGGEAVGAFEVAAAVRAAAEQKDVVAIANGMAASAAYAIASGATMRVATPSGMFGSIGVVMMHVDMSGALQQAGLKPTLIFAGAHKVDGNPFESLPKDVQARFQDEINQFYELFVSAVAEGTGMSAEAIRATEARMFTGQKAVDMGLADGVASFEQTVTAMGNMKQGELRSLKTSSSPQAAA
jgi:signal peptide peptidase SppA